MENGSAPKTKKDRTNPLLHNALLVLTLMLGFVLWWAINRETPEITLKYGELKQILQDPGATLQRVSVSRNDVRGEIVTSDPVLRSDSIKPGVQARPAPVTEVRKFRTPRTGLENDFYLQQLIDKKIGANYEGEPEESRLMNAVWMLVSPLILLGMVLAGALVVRWMMGGSSPLTFGRSRHKLYAEKDLKITFRDVAGIDEAVAELREVVDFLKTPQKYQILGGRIPKGVLLVGPPGTGKTLLAKAVAGEAEAPFFSLSGSDFVEMFVGVGAARVRDLFAQAEQRAPCIIFIDELDALGKSRGNGTLGGHDEREQTLNQLLVEMDGFDSNRGVIIMAATNRPETLDQALLRPGRFDRTVVVDQPDIVGREAILKVHTRNIRLGPDVDLRRVAVLTPGSVGADLANLVNEAALMAARNNKSTVSMAEFEEAIERGAVGLERKSRIMRADEKQRVAYHEAGHALVTCALPNTHPVQKVSIIPRGVGALGYVLSRPEDDRYLTTQSELESRIRVLLGGTLAEELVFREVSTGATSDLQKASGIARSMVKEFGMSRLGRVYFQEQNRSTFLAGFSGESGGDFSELTAREIDMEVRQILDTATRQVRALLLSRRAALEAVAQRLIEKEVIDGSELRQILDQFHTAPQLLPGSQSVGDPAAKVESGVPIVIAPGGQAGTV